MDAFIRRVSSIDRRVVIVGTIVAAALIIVLRKPDSLQNPQFFAEDGTVFFIGARQLGLVAFVKSYGGYLHLFPRFVAWGASYVDPLWVPAIYNFTGLCMNVLVVAVLLSPRVRLPAKPALALAYALVPHTGEVFMSLTNVQWCLALVLVLLLLADDAATTTQRVFDAGIVIICGLTGPFICFLFPVFVVRTALRRSYESRRLSILALVIATVQAIYLYSNRGHFMRSMPADYYELISAMVGRLYGTFCMGYGIPRISKSPIWIAVGAISVVLTAWVSFRPGLWRIQRAMISLAWLGFVLPVSVKFLHEAAVIGDPGNGDRYFFLPHVLLAWLIVIAIVELFRWWRLLPAALLMASLASNLRHLRAAPLHDYAWATHVQAIREGDAFEIPINPSGLMLEGRARNPAR